MDRTSRAAAASVPWSAREIVVPLSLLMLAGGLCALFWVGFIASDDAIYYGRAAELASGHAGLPGSHWAFRYPLVWPLAATIALFGPSPGVLGGVAVIYGLLLVLAVLAVTRLFAGAREAAWAGLLAAASPLIVVGMSTANVDAPEAILALLSLGLFVAAVGKPKPAPWLFASGLAAGLAILNRETGAGLLLVYGVLFLRGAWFPRPLYLWGALGAALLVGAEMAWFAAHGESPLYRYQTMIHTHGVLAGTYRADTPTGNVTHDTLLGPPLALLLNQEFGLLFFLTAPALWPLWRDRRGMAPGTRAMIEVAVTASIVWFLWIGYSGAIPPLPRYFIVNAVLAFVLLGIWLARMRNRRAAAGLLALMLATNLLCLSLENTNPRFAEKALANWMIGHPGPPVHVDEQTASRAAAYMTWGAPVRRLDTAPPEPGDLVFGPLAQAPAGAAVVLRVNPPKRLIGELLTGLGLDALVPEAIRARLVHGGEASAIYRLPPA